MKDKSYFLLERWRRITRNCVYSESASSHPTAIVDKPLSQIIDSNLTITNTVNLFCSLNVQLSPESNVIICQLADCESS